MRLKNGMALVVLATALDFVGEARADLFYLGYDPMQNQIEWCNDTTAVTTPVVAGNALGGGGFTQALTPLADSAKVVRVAATATACGVYDPIIFGAGIVTFNGLGGNDTMSGGFGFTFLNGGDGDDHLVVFDGAGQADGGVGDDCVASQVPGGGENLLGNLGGDCLEQTLAGGAAAVFDCGPGLDSFGPVNAGTVPVACEVPVLTCGCNVF